MKVGMPPEIETSFAIKGADTKLKNENYSKGHFRFRCE